MLKSRRINAKLLILIWITICNILGFTLHYLFPENYWILAGLLVLSPAFAWFDAHTVYKSYGFKTKDFLPGVLFKVGHIASGFGIYSLIHLINK
jgi:hypothetical protein